MKYCLDCFDQLQDCASYIGSDYLRHSLSDATLDQITYLNGAFLFLLDRTYFKENGGKDLTDAVKESIFLNYDPKILTENAVSLSESIKNPSFLKDDSSFSTYFKWICESESYVSKAMEDDLGKLTLSYLKSLSTLIEIDAKTVGLDPIKVNEVVFVNTTYAVGLILKGFFGKEFLKFSSYDYFDEVSLHAERIRSEILD